MRRPVTDRFEVLRYSKSAPEPQWRSGSPPGGSTLTTSAPASAKSFEQYGPAISVVQSTTRTPSSISAHPGQGTVERRSRTAARCMQN